MLRLQHAVRAAQDSAVLVSSAADAAACSEHSTQLHVASPRPSELSITAADGRTGTEEQRWRRAAPEQPPETHALAYSEDVQPSTASAAAAASEQSAAESSAGGEFEPQQLRQEEPGWRQGFWKRVGEMLRNARIAFCIHNLAYQGIFPLVNVADTHFCIISAS